MERTNWAQQPRTHHQLLMATPVTAAVAALFLLVQTAAGAAATFSYTYDGAGRLSAIDDGGGNAMAYTYDAAGNLLSRAETGSPTLADAIAVMRTMAGVETPVTITAAADLDADHAVGLPELLALLRDLAKQ